MNAYTKEYFEALKVRHPFPGGWRKNTRSSEIEDKFAGCCGWRTGSDAVSPLSPIFVGRSGPVDSVDFLTDASRTPDPKHDYAAREPRTIVLYGQLFVSKRWVVETLTTGWTFPGFSKFVWIRKDIQRHKFGGTVWYYDASAIVRALSVMKKVRFRPHIRGSVAGALQGAGSINDKLLAFVQNGASCK